MDSGPPGWFVGWMVFVIVAAIIGFSVRISIARRLARKVGIDEGAATAAEIFGTGAITSMYLDAHRASGAADANDPGHAVPNLSPELRRDIGED